MTQSRHAHEPFSNAQISRVNDEDKAICYACWSPISRFWIFDDYDQLPFTTGWELVK